MKTVGIVLAAGASSRMGRPKALLCDPDAVPLAARQARVLQEGGCSSTAVVLGCAAEALRPHLPPALEIRVNARWSQGRVSSMQTGMQAFPDAAGWLFLPVDAAGVKPTTIRMLLDAAEKDPAHIWRPTYKGEKGNLLWIPACLAQRMALLSADARMDEWVEPMARRLEMPDAAVLRNVNTPEEWAAWLRQAEG
ncbi:MAG: nucleotidyltransferase family protein [Verrucomicrobiota bacterium]|nr:nucleotidyltransferase family protein [Verrucomicrobiota bacterium]